MSDIDMSVEEGLIVSVVVAVLLAIANRLGRRSGRKKRDMTIELSVTA